MIITGMSPARKIKITATWRGIGDLLAVITSADCWSLYRRCRFLLKSQSVPLAVVSVGSGGAAPKLPCHVLIKQ